MNKSTLGLIETYGFIGAVAALDTAAKAANIELVGCEFVKGGIVTILITGEVAAVKAAVEASEAEVTRLGVLLNTHVIARADENVWGILKYSKETTLDMEIKEEINDDLSSEVIEVESETKEGYEALDEIETEEAKTIALITNENEEEDLPCEAEESENIRELELNGVLNSREELEKLKVTELRTIARQMKAVYKISLTKKQIKFSKKEQLIDAILKATRR